MLRKIHKLVIQRDINLFGRENLQNSRHMLRIFEVGNQGNRNLKVVKTIFAFDEPGMVHQKYTKFHLHKTYETSILHLTRLNTIYTDAIDWLFHF